MKSNSKKQFFEAIGLVAIVGSLIFVGFQLRQDRVIAQAELSSGSFEVLSLIQEDLSNHDLARVFAKMLEQPEDLTFVEKLQLDNLFRRVTGAYTRDCYLMGRGILVECEHIIRDTAWIFFGNKYGQSWYQLNGLKGDEDNELFPVPDWIEAEIESYEPNSYRLRVLGTNTAN
jgi:hypothetical protein